MNFQIEQAIPEDLSTLSPENTQKRFSKSNEIFSKKWTVAENILYARYLKNHKGQMNNQKKKKSGKFIKMANFVGSKSQNQCRSHHQKMLLTFNSIQNISKYVNQVKKKGQLISLEEYQQTHRIDLQNNEKKYIEDKIEKEISTSKQSQLEIKQNQVQNRPKQLAIYEITTFQQDSKMEQIQILKEDLFDVLNIDASDKYTHFFAYCPILLHQF